MDASKKVSRCRLCKFANGPDASQCLLCRAPLWYETEDGPEAEAEDEHTRPATARPRQGQDEAVGWISFSPPPITRGAPSEPKAARRPAPAPPAAPGRAGRGTAGSPAGPPREPATPSPGDRTQKVRRDEVLAGLSGREIDGILGEPPAPASRQRRKPDGQEQAPAWLRARSMPPVPLGLKPQLVLGRGPRCDLVLPHPQVSRKHAVIRLQGKHLVLHDEGSANGSYLNGRRVTGDVTLMVGDQLTIGPYELEVVSPERALLDADRARGDTTDVGAVRSGAMDTQPLAEVLFDIEFHKRTGTLELVSGDRRGFLAVSEGKPLFAAFAAQTDEEAVLGMLTVQSGGRFQFVSELPPGQPRMRASISSLLFEASRRLDEGQTSRESGVWDIQRQPPT